MISKIRFLNSNKSEMVGVMKSIKHIGTKYVKFLDFNVSMRI